MNKLKAIIALIVHIFNKIFPGKISESERARLNHIENIFPAVLSTSETLEIIIKNNASICRFGDAEFDISNFEKKNDPYQTPSKKLSKRLQEILLTPTTLKLIIAIPPFNPLHNNPPYYKNISFWEWYWLNRYEKLSPLLKNSKYGNSFVSRDAVFFENELSEIKKIWEDRKVVFVVSSNGRFIFEPRLFDNTKERETILVPATSAFNEYDRILSEAKKYSKEYLFLIAAGPTACVLAYDLSNLGYQAIDMGHISNCYLQFLGEAKAPETLPMQKKS